jgi:hypothetical protein
MFHKKLERLILIKGKFPDNLADFNLGDEIFQSLVIMETKTKSWKVNLVVSPVYGKFNNFSRPLAVSNRPYLRSNELFKDVMSSKNATSKTKSVLSNHKIGGLAVKHRSANGVHRTHWTVKGVEGAYSTQDFIHVNFHIEPLSKPIIRPLVVTARGKLNALNLLVSTLATSVEGTTPIISFVQLAII